MKQNCITHTTSFAHTKTFSGRGATRLLTLLALICGALCLNLTTAFAQVIGPGSSFPEKIVSSFSVGGGYDDVVTNCDMIDVGEITWEVRNPKIKAVSWSNWPGGSSISSAVCGFYVEDYFGNSTTVNLPNCLHPDIVLANSPQPGSGMAGYQVLVVYYKFTSSSGTPTSTDEMWLDVYDINNVGMPSITCNLRTSFQLTSFGNGYPHIDMWTDPVNTVDGFPGLHKFAVTWADNGSTADLNLYYGEVNDVGTPFCTTVTSLLSSIYSSPVPQAFMPDVACVTDNTSGSLDMVELVYGTRGYSDPLVRTNWSDNLMQLEWDLTTSGAVPTVTGPYQNWRVFAPRIEAMSQYTGGGHNPPAKWEIATCQFQSTYSEVWGYNDLNGTSGTNMSSVLSPLYPYPSIWPTPLIGMGAAVGAGVGPSMGTGNIGNRQYTTGMYPWQHDSVYARDVDVTTGNLITSTACYVMNSPSSPVVYPWDVNQCLSIANSSNSGQDIISAWHNGTDVVYKRSQANTTMAFRMANPMAVGNTANTAKRLYPNPAHDNLNYTGDAGLPFTVTDVTGKVILSGTHSAKGIDISGLSNGIYLLNTQVEGAKAETIKFTKQ